MCQLNNKCYRNQCVGAIPILGCIAGGVNDCSTCAVGLMASAETMQQDEAGEWQAPLDAIHGVLVPDFGWVIEDAGKSLLQAGDVVLTIQAKDGEQFKANEAYFYLHWAELQTPDCPREYAVRFWRPGTNALLTLTLTRG
jgi:hypothetical protein